MLEPVHSVHSTTSSLMCTPLTQYKHYDSVVERVQVARISTMAKKGLLKEQRLVKGVG